MSDEKQDGDEIIQTRALMWVALNGLDGFPEDAEPIAIAQDEEALGDVLHALGVDPDDVHVARVPVHLAWDNDVEPREPSLEWLAADETKDRALTDQRLTIALLGERVRQLEEERAALLAAADGPNLAQLQRTIPWKGAHSDEFNANKQEHKHFAHAVLHIVKAAGKLLAFIDEMDHAGALDPAQGDVNSLADVQYCVLRAANVFPGGRVELSTALAARIAEKGTLAACAGVPAGSTDASR